MRLATIFLRRETSLPPEFTFNYTGFSEGWMRVEKAVATEVDGTIRDAGWHFMWLTHRISGWAFGRSKESAVHRAVEYGLKHTKKRFNAAELARVKAFKAPGFYLARALLSTRHIQRQACLDLADEMVLREAHAQ